MLLNIVCMGTSYQIVAYLRKGEGSPSSQECLDAFQTAWQSWASWPKHLVTDLGLHNRGVFARTLAMNGTQHQPIALESPEMIGRVERKGGSWKSVATRVITGCSVVGEREMKMVVPIINSIVNETSRKGGYAPVQWVLGKLPRSQSLFPSLSCHVPLLSELLRHCVLYMCWTKELSYIVFF